MATPFLKTKLYPWLMIGLPFFAISLVLVYAVPEPFRHGDALFW